MHQGQYGFTTKFQKAMKMYTVEVGEHCETLVTVSYFIIEIPRVFIIKVKTLNNI